ncbi:hypothetical protein [Pseudomonas sp. GZJR-8]|uniref:hypothetical protein n=1 Tax=Pseudomonas sp. GZJR-8 TaxID=1395925 RepID=UPI000CDB7D48|nr:hypothetical protein [Pseudomonas sp. GZJR-8]
MIVFYAFLFLVFGVGGAYALRSRLSGEGLNSLKLFLCLVFNGFFVVSYIEVIKYCEFPFFGVRTDFIIQYPILEWIAFFGILAHGFALPVKWKTSDSFERKKEEGR